MVLDGGFDAPDGGSSVLAKALAYRRLMESSVELNMLRSDNLALAAAAIGMHFRSAATRIPTDEFHEELGADLELLKAHFEIGERSAKSYCDDWRRAGILIRRAATHSRGEVYEVSADALAAIRVLDAIDAPRTTLTESRLVSLANAVHQLSVDTDPDTLQRIEALEREREAIDRQIALIRSGELTTLNDRSALERVDDILQQAQDIPADFGRVRTRFEELNRSLRAGILASDDSAKTVLDDVFRGVDIIRDSDEGRTFAAFSELLRDPERSAQLDAGLNAVLDRPFAMQLPAESRRHLRNLVFEMKEGSRDVDATLTEFARGLRLYVLSQEFQRDRVLRDSLKAALAAAQRASMKAKPYADTGIAIDSSSIRISTVGEMLPHDPSEYDAGEPLPDEASAFMDFAALAALTRDSEIDYDELAADVNDVLERCANPTIGRILDKHPATQGLASIIGLLSLAVRHGRVEESASERLTWRGRDGISRSAQVPVHAFVEPVVR
jgi:hypothetical protein